MRVNGSPPGTEGRDALYKQAMYEFWPWLSALLVAGAGGNEFDEFICFCGRGRDHQLVERVFVKNPLLVVEPDVFNAITCAASSLSQFLAGVDVPAVGSESAIVGVKLICDTADDIPDAKPLAVQFLPTSKDKLFYANTPSSLRRAIDGRVVQNHDKGAAKLDLTVEEKIELGSAVELCVDDINTSECISRIAAWLLFEDYKSPKWSIKRAETQLMILMAQWDPNYQLKASIKLEPMGKKNGIPVPPRMLIADGDLGAVMSACIVGVLERFYRKRKGHRMTKGAGKADVMYRVCKQSEGIHNMNRIIGFILENDGTAWDVCCGHALRELIENKIIDAVVGKLGHLFTPVSHFTEPRKKVDTAKKHTLTATPPTDGWYTKLAKGAIWGEVDMNDDEAKAQFRKQIKEIITAIRRSGDRGTSILNWITNECCWAWVLCGAGSSKFVRYNQQRIVDIFGIERLFRAFMEGDDSLLWLSGLAYTKEQLAVLHSRWLKLGMLPKLFQRVDGDVAEFVGWKIAVNHFGLDWDTAMPDVPRLLQNAGYSTAKAAVLAAVSGDSKEFGHVVSPAVMARASSIAMRTPSIARWLCDLALEANEDLEDSRFSRDDLFRMNGDLQELLPEWWQNDDPARLLKVRFLSFADQTNSLISESIATGGACREAELAVRHGWVETEGEWRRFVGMLPAVTRHTSCAEFRAILPAGMQ